MRRRVILTGAFASAQAASRSKSASTTRGTSPIMALGRRRPAPPAGLVTRHGASAAPNSSRAIACTRGDGSSASLLAGRAPMAITTPPWRQNVATFSHVLSGSVSAAGSTRTRQRRSPCVSVPLATLASCNACEST